MPSKNQDGQKIFSITLGYLISQGSNFYRKQRKIGLARNSSKIKTDMGQLGDEEEQMHGGRRLWQQQ